MKITKAKYSEENKCVLATIDNIKWAVPIDSANRHYQAIQEWAKIDGNTIEDAD